MLYIKCNLIANFGRKNGSMNTCKCDVPCNQNKYDVTMSYAHLSRFSVVDLLQDDTGKHALIQQRFREVREITQRTMDDIVQADIKQFGIAVQNADTLGHAIIKGMELINNDLPNATAYFSYNIANFIKKDDELIRSISAKTLDKLYDYHTPLYRVTWAIQDINYTIFHFTNGNTFNLTNMVEKCILQSLNSTHDSPRICISVNDWLEKSYYYMYKPIELDKYMLIYDKYINFVDGLFNGTGSDHHENHNVCKFALATFVDQVLPEIVDVSHLLLNFTSMSSSNDYIVLLQLSVMLENKYSLLYSQMVSFLQVVDSVYKPYLKILDPNLYWEDGDEEYATCEWVKELVDAEASRYLGALDNIQAAIISAEVIKTGFSHLYKDISLLKPAFNQLTQIQLVAIKQYMSGNNTKRELAKVFGSSETQYVIENLGNILNELAPIIVVLKSDMTILYNNIEETLHIVFNLTVPLFNTTSIKELKLFSYINLVTDHDILVIHSDGVDQHTGHILSTELQNIMSRFYDMVDAVATDLYPALKHVAESFQALEDNLKTYEEEANMDKDFVL